jgi:hypothetical protein
MAADRQAGVAAFPPRLCALLFAKMLFADSPSWVVAFKTMWPVETAKLPSG